MAYFAKNLWVNKDKSSISQNLFLKIYSSSLAFETECISRPNPGTSADVHDVPSATSDLMYANLDQYTYWYVNSVII